MAKLAVIFPGVGYTKDRPLLYYATKLAIKKGYKTLFLDFSGIDWSKEKLKDEAFLMETLEMCLKRTEAALSEIKTEDYEDILFISKSIGTVVATAYADKVNINVSQICFTPLEFIELYVKEGNALVFYGDSDPYADPGSIARICSEKKLEAYHIANANHSLETKDVKKDIENIAFVMSKVEEKLFKNSMSL